MPDEVNAAVEAVKPPSLQSKRNSAGTDPEGEKLPPRDDAVLPRREIGDQSVDGARMHNSTIGAPRFFDSLLLTDANHNIALGGVNGSNAEFFMWIRSPRGSAAPPGLDSRRWRPPSVR
jgi:hypothetical protein